MEKIATNPLKLVHQAATALDFQRRQDANTLARLRELVTTFNNSHRQAVGQLQQAQQHLVQLRDENSQLKVELTRMQLQGNSHHGSPGSGGGGQQFMSQHPQQQQQPVQYSQGPSLGRAASAIPYNQRPSLGSPFNNGAASHQLQHAYHTSTSPSQHQQGRQSWQPPLKDAQQQSHIGQKRPRDDGAAVAEGVDSPLRSLMDPNQGERFRLATPAVTLRGHQQQYPQSASSLPREFNPQAQQQQQWRSPSSAGSGGRRPNLQPAASQQQANTINNTHPLHNTVSNGTGSGRLSLQSLLPAGPAGNAARIIHSSHSPRES